VLERKIYIKVKVLLIVIFLCFLLLYINALCN